MAGASTAALRVLLADDEDLLRAGLLAVLSTDDTIDVVGEATDGLEAVTQARALMPDVVLMDVRMPRQDGIAATRELAEVAPSVRVLILTTFEDQDYVLGALTAGASGFLLKRTPPEKLIEAIHTVAAGDALLSPSITRTVIDQMAAAAPPDLRAVMRLRDLTARERDVLVLVARGMSNLEVAMELFVEESTVKTHMKRILAKLDLRDRVQAVIFAYETGLIRPGSGRGNG